MLTASDYNKEREKVERFLKYALVLSFLFHLILVLFLRAPIQEISLSDQEEKIRIVLSPQEKPETVPEQNKNRAKPKQIVSSEDGKKEKPKDTRFLGKQDQAFDRQTVAKKVGSFKEAGKGIRKGVEQKQVAKKHSEAT